MLPGLTRRLPHALSLRTGPSPRRVSVSSGRRACCRPGPRVRGRRPPARRPPRRACGHSSDRPRVRRPARPSRRGRRPRTRPASSPIVVSRIVGGTTQVLRTRSSRGRRSRRSGRRTGRSRPGTSRSTRRLSPRLPGPLESPTDRRESVASSSSTGRTVDACIRVFDPEIKRQHCGPGCVQAVEPRPPRNISHAAPNVRST